MEIKNQKGEIKGPLLQIGKQKEKILVEQFIPKSSEEIISFIIDTYHTNLKKNFPILTKSLLKIMAHHIREYKDLLWEIHKLFSVIRDTFEEHLIIEEELIFKPMIKHINGELSKDNNEYKQMVNYINEAMNEHFIIGPSLKKLAEITNNYNAPRESCGSIKKFYIDMAELQNEVMTHTQIENNILFPRFLV